MDRDGAERNPLRSPLPRANSHLIKQEILSDPKSLRLGARARIDPTLHHRLARKKTWDTKSRATCPLHTLLIQPRGEHEPNDLNYRLPSRNFRHSLRHVPPTAPPIVGRTWRPILTSGDCAWPGPLPACIILKVGHQPFPPFSKLPCSSFCLSHTAHPLKLLLGAPLAACICESVSWVRPPAREGLLAPFLAATIDAPRPPTPVRLRSCAVPVTAARSRGPDSTTVRLNAH